MDFATIHSILTGTNLGLSRNRDTPKDGFPFWFPLETSPKGTASNKDSCQVPVTLQVEQPMEVAA